MVSGSKKQLRKSVVSNVDVITKPGSKDMLIFAPC